MKSRQSNQEDNSHILLLSSDRPVQKSLYEMLCRSGYSVKIATSVEETIPHLEKNPRHIILTDMHESGIELLNIIKENGCNSPIIILTSYSNTVYARETINLGIFDYLVRPVDDKKIISAIEKAVASLPGALEGVTFARKPAKKDETFYGLVGRNANMKEIYSLVERIANTKATVLLYGESGTGKRMIAQAIHKADKNRKDKPFIEVSCGALPKDIIESELFGHTKGAFTGAILDRKGRFELADGGTILLDDIDSFTPELQVKLLRVLQQKEFERVGDHKTTKVDVRVIVSTNQNLEKAVEDGRFREDLYYRLNVIAIQVPPLRERTDDLPLLIEHFVDFYAKENYKKVKSVSDEVRRILAEHNWPGNIRELENIIERAVILDTDNMINKNDLPEAILNRIEVFKGKATEGLQKIFSSLKNALEEPEKLYILKILQEVGWNKKKAALRLGVNRTTLYNKLRRYNIAAASDKNKK